MEVLTTVGILSKLTNSFPTYVLKQEHVDIAYPRLSYAFTSWEKAPATYKNIKNVKRGNFPPKVKAVILGWKFKSNFSL